jgi:beta-alanine degradation protein BauB
MFKKTLIAALLSAAVLGSGMAIAQESAPHPVHEAQSVSIPAHDIKFFKAGVKAAAGELEAGPAYGNLQAGRHGTFIHMPAGFVSVPHIHTEDYYAVVIKGVGANDPVNATPKPLSAGSYWFQRGEENHVTRCLSNTDCLFFIVQPGKFDYVPAK